MNPTRDPVAREWADPGFPIKGWTVIFDRSRARDLTAKQILALRKPGNVVSGGRRVGIVSDERKLISASSVTGAVEHNDYSFKLPNQDQFSSAAEYERMAKEQDLPVHGETVPRKPVIPEPSATGRDGTT